MRLKKLDISGFKSFGKAVTLEFATPVVAVVGPNGSGKSNVAEAMRWVLGEQSMKSLRGKRGEDLIFHGSNSASQLGKAMVRVTLDNADHLFPLDFDEVIISREVYRDGVNEYSINGSAARLKDIIELLSHAGIGGSGHHIISQGEADRILYASPKERRGMIEDALGLKIFEIKRAEAERKLVHTEENVAQVAALRREIQPHMKFLRVQVEKMEAAGRIREELAATLAEYIAREQAALDAEEVRIAEEEKPYRTREAELTRAVADMRARAGSQPARVDTAAIDALQKSIMALEENRRALERELGAIEGQLVFIARRTRASGQRSVFVADVDAQLHAILRIADAILALDSVEAIKKQVQALKRNTEEFLQIIGTSETEEHTDNTLPVERLQQESERIRAAMESIEKEHTGQLAKRAELEKAYRMASTSLLQDAQLVREKEEELYRIKDALRACDIARERLRLRTEEFARERAESAHVMSSDNKPAHKAVPMSDSERNDTRERIQRLKIKLEEAGGVDERVRKEYEDVSTREAFLAREVEDLEKSAQALRSLMKDLEENLELNFSAGIQRINKEFGKLFEDMFGGGDAELKVLKSKKRVRAESVEDAQEELLAETGVDITINIPRKRVKNLDMLSGGERALTSIALLFAMSSVNPPPFLVLDETDAALDEANSQRYGTLLRRLSKRAQLVLITHNRMTMKEAGVLYGVTMGADGISKLLSIKFDEAKEMATV